MMNVFLRTVSRHVTRTERIVLPLLSLPLAATVFLFLIRYVPTAPKALAEFPRTAVLAAAALSVALLVAGVTAFTPPRRFRIWTVKTLLTSLPGVLVVVGFWLFMENTPESVRALTSLYFFALFAFLSVPTVNRLRPLVHAPKMPEPSFREWMSRQGAARLLAVLGLTGVFFGFATHDLGKFAAVDEALWLYNRIPRYWEAIRDRDPYDTNISDKPGVTIALSSGAGMLRYPDPKAWKSIEGSREGVEGFFAAYRLPVAVTVAIFLPLFYYLLERLAGRRKALLAYAFLALAPPTAGMTGIINPDSLLWVFTPLSLVAFLVYRKREHAGFLLLSGILLGLALLTKYVANILFVFMFGLMFLEYVLRRDKIPFLPFLRRELVGYATWTVVGMTTFFVLFPAVWVKPDKLLDATILSEAFGAVAPIFLLLLATILADHRLNRARISESAMTLLRKRRHLLVTGIAALWTILLAATATNVWTGMRWFDFPSLLASPKSIGHATGFLGAFTANAYPLLFGIIPLSFFLLFIAPISLLKKDVIGRSSGRMTLYGILFMLLYYLGTTVNGVGAMTRYQIILFPVAAIVSGLALDSLLRFIEKRFPMPARLGPLLHPITLVIVAATGIATLARTPFPLSYASSLLPLPYVTDVKDMGPGSYEAAAWLNTLPDAEKVRIWTDKSGVCKFFDGECNSSFDWDEYAAAGGFDYVVVSSGRESRTASNVLRAVRQEKENVVRFDEYYGRPEPDWSILINGRPSHYVSVYRLGND